ncbi:hypothetical protein CORC01_06087 [Colletotrichum orchidophilum]|uniref:Major facilitator superfamily (MFS) profile domain-containing protein n=1 Tax=Colletotrichum orchidophilum TaxID=1209926 RepID=A0A1G4BBC8_9PEZI|nr:uncharacterized protein CORC01_06087 [Colletotrichum orchidophilum]OHE98636.1 hypothetical protein CORC01_06087 [Colletotrichum orchidophilum]
MASIQDYHVATGLDEPRYPEPVALAERRSRVSSDSSRHSRTSSFSWFRLSADGRPWGPVDELSLYMGTAFSSIPDDDKSTRSPYFAPPASNCSTVSEKDPSYVVDWKKPQDTEDPMRWSMRSSWVQILLSVLSCTALASRSPFISSAEVPAPLRSPRGAVQIADVAHPASRGRAVAVYSIALLLGPILGPASGGLLAEYLGSRWIFWTLCIMAGTLTLDDGISPMPMISVGLLLYVWPAEKAIFWLVPMIGTAVIGIGIIFVFIPRDLVDAFRPHATSALAASTIFCSVFGAFLPLASSPMYSGQGLGWGYSILVALAVIMAPIP